MSSPITITHINKIKVERMEKKDGWAISEFRLPITGNDGSSTAVFHSIFRPGSTHAKHLHKSCDEIAVYLKGHGIVGQSDSRAEVTSGHCRLMPRGTEHFFYNETKEEDAEVIGFYLGAKSVPETGYKFCGHADTKDLTMPREGLNEGVLVQLEECNKTIEANNIYINADLRVPIGIHNGSENALIFASFKPGGGLVPNRSHNCEQIYYVISGNGLAGSANYQLPVNKGSFVFIPRGTTHWLKNQSSSNELEIYNVLTGAGSLAEANYMPVEGS